MLLLWQRKKKHFSQMSLCLKTHVFTTTLRQFCVSVTLTIRYNPPSSHHCILFVDEGQKITNAPNAFTSLFCMYANQHTTFFFYLSYFYPLSENHTAHVQLLRPDKENKTRKWQKMLSGEMHLVRSPNDSASDDS